MENDEELGYVSTSPDLDTKRTKEVIADERDMPSLQRLQKQLGEDIESYTTIDRLVLGDKTFTVDQQLAINKSIAAHLRGYKSTVDNAIINVREALKNG